MTRSGKSRFVLEPAVAEVWRVAAGVGEGGGANGGRKNGGGVLIVDKPVGPSSMDVIRAVRRWTGVKKVGHAGTLDPLASGVVLVCVGKATKRVEGLMGRAKVYEAGVDLSAFTATDDREGEREAVAIGDDAIPSREAIGGTLENFLGEIDQKPPAFSAIHVGGKRAYQLARGGGGVDLPTRRVRIDAIEIVSYAWPDLRLRVSCGKGVYIRSLARELGEALGTGGHLSSLRRTAVGEYRVEDGVKMDAEEWTFDPPLETRMLRRADEQAG